MSYDNIGDVPVSELTHYGVKGMRWGIRRRAPVNVHPDNVGLNRRQLRAKRKANFAELKAEKAKNNARYKEARKDPTFNREVKLTQKGKGVKGTNMRSQQTKGELFTGHITGNFKNSEGKPVSEDFANAVSKEALRRNDRNAKISSIAAAGIYGAIGSAVAARAGATPAQAGTFGSAAALVGVSHVRQMFNN